MACLTEPDGQIRLATLYQAKVLRKNLASELKARDAELIKQFREFVFFTITKFEFIFCLTRYFEKPIRLHSVKNDQFSSDSMSKEVAYLHFLSASMVPSRLINVMMKILLPASFIALKLTGSFIDFMLALAKSNVQETIDLVASQVRDPRTMNFDSIHIDLSRVFDNT